MSTPRPPITEMEFRMCTCNQRDGDKTCPLHSGVAAPLGPTPDVETFFAEYHGYVAHPWISAGKLKFAEAYAAAVSKNLQEENKALTRRGRELVDELAVLKAEIEQDGQMFADGNKLLGEYCARILELESEITALRETK